MKARSILLAALAAGMLVPAAASAQDAQLRHDRQDIRQDERRARDDRRDYHEDWRGYRDAHRDAFRRPAYAGPAGYRYRPVAAGYRFAPAYYGREHWVTDYARYRLPAPGRHQRWVRYGNDVMLLDVGSGRVALVHRGFFW